ncbi:MAG: DUF348 domain-containing protein [Anaerolineales bacterium]|nr:DUF348 domain-containing protein [Anaerolineales bacterium]
MNRKLLALVSLVILGLIAASAAAFGLREPTFLIIDDGLERRVSGEFTQVGELLSAAGITLRPEDIVAPGVNEAIPAGTAILIQRARPVILRTEAGSQTYWTQQTNLGAFLTEINRFVGRTDQLYADERLVPFNALATTALPEVVEIGEFLTVTIHNNGAQQVVRTAGATVGAALVEAGITLFMADNVIPAPGTWLTPDMQIYVQRSMPLTIEVDGRIIQTRSYHTSATEVLGEAGIGLIGLDYTRPGPEVVLQANDVIQVVRVTESFRLADTDIPFETLWQPTDQMELDQRGLLQPGVPGVQRQRYRVRFENGVAVGEVPDGEWVAREPIPAIMGYGTRVVIRVVDTPQGPLEYWRVVRMRVTAYTAASSGKPVGHPTYGITRSGLPAGYGIVAVDPRVVPFMSNVYVPGYGVGLAGDTGGGVKGRWIDLGYDEDNYQSWSGYIDVYYLTPVPPPENINYLIPTQLP